MPKIHRPTDFFERQDLARRNTARLLALFVAVILFLTAGSYLVLMLFVDAFALMAGVENFVLLGPLFDEEASVVFQPEIFVAAIVGTALVIGLGSYLKTASLSEGGPAVADALGATDVNTSSDDPLIRRFVNVVEEMSLASGVPVPQTYVLEDQPGINAFAAGYTVNDAAIAVTRGALRQLTRDELQGVVAHEFSHILHGDMKLNIRLIGLLHGILCIYLAGITLCQSLMPDHWTNDTTRATGQVNMGGFLLVIPGFALIIVGAGGLIGSRFIKAGIARQREYLADASAIQYTRNPAGLAGALKKVGGFSHGSQLQGSKAELVSHMCFGEASSSWFTHPPVEERLLAVDPEFNPDLGFLVLDADVDRSELDPSEVGSQSSEGPGGLEGTALDGALNADDIINAIGQTSPEQLIYCATLLAIIPEPLKDARTSLAGAVAIAYLLLIDNEDKEMRRQQAQIIQQDAAPSVAQQAQKLWPSVRNLDEELRLPLMDLLIPVLRQMTPEQFEEFSAICDRLIRLDDEVSFREFVLERVVLHHLEVTFGEDRTRVAQYNSFSGVSRDLENVLSALAYTASDDLNVVKRSFQAGLKQFLPRVRKKLSFRERDRWDFDLIAGSLERLSLSSPAIRKAFIQACAHCVMADDVIVVSEVEMLRAICEILEAPLPPFIPQNTRRDREETMQQKEDELSAAF